MTRPHNVRIQRRDGTTIPLELADGGVNEDGIHVWLIATPVSLTNGDQLLAESIPGRTEIRFPIAEEDVDGEA